MVNNAALSVDDNSEILDNENDLFFDNLDKQVAAASSYIDDALDARHVHTELIKMVAAVIARELNIWLSWVNELSQDEGWQIKLKLVDNPDYGATVTDHSVVDDESKVASVLISLGTIPVLIGVANRIVMSRNGPLGMLHDFMPHGEPGRQWNPVVDPMGYLCWEEDQTFNLTARIAVDSMVLMFLHEVTHAFRAHLHHPEVKKQASKVGDSVSTLYRRAAESDADAGSGWLFVTGRERSDIKEASRNFSEADDDTVQRLVFGAMCNYVALQIRFKQNAPLPRPYHFPVARERCTLYGGNVAWLKLDKGTEDFTSKVNLAYNQVGYFEQLVPTAIKNWVSRASPEAIADLESYERFTLILVDEISSMNKMRSSTCLPYRLSKKSENSFFRSGQQYEISFGGLPSRMRPTFR